MIKYFKFKKINEDGNRALYLKEKKDIFDKYPKETYISKKGSLIIYGIEASGKSQKLRTIVNMVDSLWKNEIKIIFKATDSLSEILYKNLDNDEETQKLLITNPHELEDIEDMIDVYDESDLIEILNYFSRKFDKEKNISFYGFSI